MRRWTARDGITPSFLTDSDLVSDMVAVDSHAVWSLLDAKGTQTMMKSVLGVASQLADYDTVKNRMKGSRATPWTSPTGCGSICGEHVRHASRLQPAPPC